MAEPEDRVVRLVQEPSTGPAGRIATPGGVVTEGAFNAVVTRLESLESKISKLEGAIASSQLAGQGCPVDGVTTGWKVGQLYLDTQNSKFYWCASPADRPHTSGVGTEWLPVVDSHRSVSSPGYVTTIYGYASHYLTQSGTYILSIQWLRGGSELYCEQVLVQGHNHDHIEIKLCGVYQSGSLIYRSAYWGSIDYCLQSIEVFLINAHV